jgi:hypothetical protein
MSDEQINCIDQALQDLGPNIFTIETKENESGDIVAVYASWELPTDELQENVTHKYIIRRISDV